MRLQKIVIHGFKSFVEKTELDLLAGVTCIVGPNGCGKSNLADAVRWALGEQSPKVLRGQRMEDVIFQGSASRKPLGFAEVNLLFSNDGALEVPWSEVSVARRLYRTGESEYLLNRNACRLRDIHDLFAGTGVNPKAYALMDQDRLNHVLTAKPWERRVFIEEAAGIARYKQQRTETRGKLEATRQNLQRVRDVMDEVRRQLGSLERQARRAQQYKALHQEKQSLALLMLAADFAALTAQHHALAGETQHLRGEEATRRARIAQVEAQEALQQAAIQVTEHRLGDLRQSVQKIQGEVERLLERREQTGIQLQELEAEEVRLAEEIRGVGERRQALEAERQDKERVLGEARERQAERERALNGLERELESRRSALRARRERLEQLRLEQIRVAAERADLTRAVGELRERGLHLERQGERLRSEAAAARGEAERLGAERRRLETSHRQTGAQLSLLESERQQVEAHLQERESQREEVQAALAEARLGLASRQSALEGLRRLEHEREGYGAGVRAIFSGAPGARPEGVVGTVADLLEVPSGLEAAVEGVLGDRLQWVVVERFEQARAAVAYLDREGVGSATFLPLETIPATPVVTEDSPEVRWVARLVSGPHPALLSYLLGRVGAVAHLDDAEKLWRRNGVVATYVTPSGEVLSATGRLSGGRRNGDHQDSDHSILRRKRAIRQLEEHVAGLTGDTEAALARLELLDAEIVGLRLRQSTLQSSVQVQEAARLTGEKDLESVLREEDRVQRHLNTLATERQQLDAESVETARRLEELDHALTGIRAAEVTLDRELGDLRGVAEAAQEAEAALLGEITGYRVDHAAVAERVEGLAQDIARLAELERELDSRREQSAQRRAQVAERRTEVAKERERADARAREVAVDRDRLEGEVARVAEAHQGQVTERQRLETERRGMEQEIHRLIARLHELDLRETEGRVRREELIQEARRSHGVDGAEALLGAHDPARDRAGLQTRHQELHAKLEAMGPVNLVADEEYRELAERLAFLRTQHDDLTASVKDLEKALRGMTRTAQQRFEEAFAEINRHFNDIFSRLFEGGRADLRIVAAEEGEEDPLEQGVELMAQPRGKRLQAVTLMSGGEKALTGLALLFAIFYYRPSPFCVLDEVDAPLDDANIHRFLRVLRELCSHTQFIVITHNRKTMEAADVLYGVTMEEPGLSRLVSVRLTEA
jgi:chromosome segregation protein